MSVELMYIFAKNCVLQLNRHEFLPRLLYFTNLELLKLFIYWDTYYVKKVIEADEIYFGKNSPTANVVVCSETIDSSS